MSTNSTIAIKNGNKIKAIYVHYDGYPEHMLNTLRNNFSHKSDVEKLIALGDTSYIGDTLEECKSQCYYYKAYNVSGYEHMQNEIDNDKKCFEAREFDSIESYLDFANTYEYAYIFENGNWNLSGGYMNK